MSERIRLRRLLDRGFYPKELPPVFRTSNFGTASSALIQAAPNNYTGYTNFFDGATFQGNHRTFGVINPVNYCLLAREISQYWSDISRYLRKSKSSMSSVKFPRSLEASGRSFEKVTFSEKLERQRVLSATYPATLQLDINRFYGSIYTHSIPWAILGKDVAKRRLRTRAAPAHWSESLDRMLRNCNDGQTIGIAIGPDTSRIVSEILLAAVDAELTRNGTGVVSTCFVHSIDDYEFGVYNSSEAEHVTSVFERAIRQFELRSNERKRSFSSAAGRDIDLWQHKFDRVREGPHFVEELFSLIWECWRDYESSNVVAFSLSKFRREIARSADRQGINLHLYRILYSAPHLIPWVAPFVVGLQSEGVSSVQSNRLLDWGIEEAARRHDVITVLWFIYLHLHFDRRMRSGNVGLCLALDCPLVDLMLLHGRHNNLVTGGGVELSARYGHALLKSEAWLYIYESERRNWPNFVGGATFGTPADEAGVYAALNARGATFYDTTAFGVRCFDIGLREEDFDRDIDHIDFGDEYDGPEDWDDY